MKSIEVYGLVTSQKGAVPHRLFDCGANKRGNDSELLVRDEDIREMLNARGLQVV